MVSYKLGKVRLLQKEKSFEKPCIGVLVIKWKEKEEYWSYLVN